ncbi:MAG TPA: AraC family transcriptional regulator, partial [Actinomycetota bacterium]|nr:AraC family transcriptional regulator [Actinomycetota bacterium]
DGRPAGTDGFRKRVLYVGTEVLGEELIGRAVDQPDIDDPRLLRELDRVHRAVADLRDPLAAESTFALATERLRRHLGAAPADPDIAAEDLIASHLRDLLDAHRFEPMTLAEAGRILHVSPAHLVRCFTRTFGIAPHRYVVGRRIEAARHRLLGGEPIAQVATGVGFHDQAHLTRHFKRHVGTTPARYASSAA